MVYGVGTMRETPCVFFFSSRRRHTRFDCDWSSDVCSSDLRNHTPLLVPLTVDNSAHVVPSLVPRILPRSVIAQPFFASKKDRKSTRLNSSHSQISYAVFCLKKKKNKTLKINKDMLDQSHTI